jgi:hypothetical protein
MGADRITTLAIRGGSFYTYTKYVQLMIFWLTHPACPVQWLHIQFDGVLQL